MVKKYSTKKTKYVGVYQDLQTKKYGYRVKLGTDRSTGKSIHEHRRGFRTASEANEARTTALKKKQDLGALSNTNMTYDMFMERYYIPEYRNSVESSTWRSRERILQKLKERFGNKKPRDISTLDILDFKNELLETFSQNYARLIFGMFSRTLKHAKKHGLIKENLVEIVNGIPKKKTEVTYWTKEELEKVIQTFNLKDFYEHMSFVMIFLYYMTGMRVNEATALYWSENVDFENKQIRVWHNLDFKSGKDWNRKTKMKTEAGRRIISIDDDTVKILKDWQSRQKEIGNYDFVISYTGEPLGKSTIGRIIKRHGKLAGVTPISPKGLRHSHASLLINSGVNPLVVQKRLGHSDIQITLGVYSHLYPTVDREVADQLNGQVKIQTSDITLTNWNGNQHVKPPKNKNKGE
ncbi:integrase [Natronobacillus azotifigens]|uniref:Tyrosine-type recombinase/integrase n=1 Tax=Natronobacillus azotifigens TaxID=472978 RepID=A0A9J6RF60_9BACI|nr:site-specific integrase [Natronobacillus azotifigens]MCZ0704199.1 tyrosine-type recombinase/integrase [Natronobacillus azotifigens]